VNPTNIQWPDVHNRTHPLYMNGTENHAHADHVTELGRKQSLSTVGETVNQRVTSHMLGDNEP
jgi:hypothetical protein